MRISVVAPVFNEVDFIAYSLMAIKDHINDVVYACADSTDGTDELLAHIKAHHYGDRLTILRKPEYNFDPLDLKAYNQSFNDCIAQAKGDAVWFLHPDMIVTNPEALDEIADGPLALWTNVKSYAGDFKTRIVEGRGDKWKNIHAKQFGVHYFGGYGSQNEDFYHSEITGKQYKHYGMEFAEYPFEVADSGINVNHYCELKAYKRRLEKMKLCLRTQHPGFDDDYITELATHHPRVTLEESSPKFGRFRFAQTDDSLPHVFTRYKEEFDVFKRSLTHG